MKILSVGDKVRIVDKRKIDHGQNFVNGKIYTIAKVKDDGDIYFEEAEKDNIPFIAEYEYDAIKKVGEKPEETKKLVYRVTVHNNNGSSVYYTENDDILYNYRHGNEKMIIFECTDGKRVALPDNVIIEHELFTEATVRREYEYLQKG